MSERIIDPLVLARWIASTAHIGQKDLNGVPYIAHPLRVCEALEYNDIAGRVVAMLHDVPEDCPDWSLEVLVRMGFAQEIIDALDAITQRVGEVLETYWARVRSNPIARRVKLKDIDDNEDEERLARLKPDLADHLRKKYKRARAAVT